MQTPKKQTLVPLTQAAAEIGISRATLARDIQRGIIPAVYTGATHSRAQYLTSDTIEAEKARRSEAKRNRTLHGVAARAADKAKKGGAR